MSDDLKPLRSLEFSPPLKPSSDIGQPGEIRWIPIDQLFIDHAYQRPVLQTGRKSIGRMVEEFSWPLFAPLVVSPRGENRFAIIDGQHRASAALTHGGIAELPCMVMTGDQKVEAMAFATINGMVTKVHSLMIFRARAAAGDPAAQRLVETCAEAGVKIAAFPKTNCDVGETLSVGTLDVCLKKFGANLLIEALKTVTQTGNGNAGLLREGVIAGTCDVLAAHPGWRGDRLLKAVHAVNVATMYRDAMARKGGSGVASGSLRSFYAGILESRLQASLGRPAAPVLSPEKPPPVRAEKLTEPPRQRPMMPAADPEPGGVPGDPGAGRSAFDQRQALEELQIAAYLESKGHEVKTYPSGTKFLVDGKLLELRAALMLMNTHRKRGGLIPIDLDRFR